MNDEDFERYMRMALDEAAKAVAHDDVPVGAVVVKDDKVLGMAHNERELRGDPTAHAEVLALRNAALLMGSSRLDGATLVTTLEPCPMCAGAALQSRIAAVVFGAEDPKAGCTGSLYNFGADPRLHHEFAVHARVLAQESAHLLQDFFAGKR